jgi:hypothetical protein
MASLIEKLGGTISGKVSSSISGFGAGAKSAFISANPALFAPVAGVLYKGFDRLIASNNATVKAQQDRENRNQGFKEETDRENAKVFSDMQKSLNSIDKNVLTILELLKAGAGKEKGSALGSLGKALGVAGAVGAGIPKVIFKGLGEGIADTIKALKALASALTPNFIKDFLKKIPDFFKSIPNFFKDLPNKFAGLLDNFSKYFNNLFDSAKLRFGDFFDKFGKYFDDLGAAMRIRFPETFAKLDKLVAGIGSYLDELAAALNRKLPESIKKLGQVFDDAKSGFSFESVRVGLLTKLAEFKTSFLSTLDNLVRVSKDFSQTFDIGTVVKNLDEFKLVFGESGFFGKIAVTLGAIKGLFSTAGAKFLTFVDDFKNFLMGPIKVLGELSAISDIARIAAKILEPIGKVFRVLAGPWIQGALAIFDGFSAAFNEEEIAKSLNKNMKDVNFVDRLNAFWAGVIGGAIGGLMDLGVNIYNWIMGTKHDATYQKRITSSLTEMFDGFQRAILDGISFIIESAIDLIPFLSDERRASMKKTVSDAVRRKATTGQTDQTAAVAARTGVTLNSQGRTAEDPRYAGAKIPSIAEQAAAMAGSTPKAVQPATVPLSSVAGNEGRLPLSIRNNNPGNLRFVESLTKPGYVLEGAVRGEGGFAAFPTPEAGLDAMRRQLIIDTQRRGMTVSEMLNKYAPASENDTAKYIDFVSKQTGLGANDRVPANAIPSLMRSMVTMEGGPKATSFYYGGSSAAAPQEKREAEKTVQAVQTTATETVAIRAATEKEAEILSNMGMEVETGTKLQQLHLEKLDNHNRQLQDQLQLQTRQQRELADREFKFQQERKNLELQFLREVENDIRGAMNKALGPAGMGVSGQNANMMAYRTYGSFLEKPFTKALTNVFGESGGAYGQIFSKLAGSYINQAAGAILPAMGIDPNLFNRALSNYTAGKQVREQYKLAQTEYNITKAEYDAAAAKVTLADRLNATRPGKISEIKREQIAKVDALELALQQKGATLDMAGKAKSANRSMYTEDLIMAMTGMPTGIRSMMGYESGQDQLTKQLTMMIGGPVAQTAFGGAGLQDYMNQYRQMYGQQLQGQENVAVQAAALQGQVGVNNAEMIHGVNNQLLQGWANVNGQLLQGMSGIIGGSRMQSSSGGGFFETIGNVAKTVGNLWDAGKSFLGGAPDSVGRFFDTDAQFEKDWASATAGLSGSDTDAAFEADWASATRGLTESSNVLTKIGNFFSPTKTSTGAGSSIPGVRGATMPNKMSPTDIAGNFLGSAISNKLGISGPSAGIVSSAMKDLLGGKGFGKTSSYIQGPGTFASSLFNIYGLKNANTSTLGGTLNTALNAYQLYNGIASGSMIASAGNLIQSAGSMLGSQTIANFGSGMASGQTSAQLASAYGQAGMATPSGMSAGATAGQFANAAGGIIGGHYLGRSIAGGYKVGGMGNTTTNVGTAIGFALGGPVGALIGGALGGTVNRLFGRKPRAVSGTGIQGTMGGLDASGMTTASGQAYTDWFEKGGKYRSDRSGRDYSAIDPELLKYFAETTGELQKTYGEFGKVMGFDPNALRGYQKDFDISFKGLNEKQSVEKIQKSMKQYARDMLVAQYGDIARFALDLGDNKKEDILDTFQRLAKSTQLVDYWMRGFGNTVQETADFLAPRSMRRYSYFGNPQDDKLGMANRKYELIQGFGGEEQFNEAMKGAFGALFTQEEQLQFAQREAVANANEMLTASVKAFSPEVQAQLDKFAAGGIKTAEDVEAARLAYRAAIDAAEIAGNKETWTELIKAGPTFMEAANLSLQAALINKDAAEKTKTAEEFFGFTEVEDFSKGIANGIADAAPQMAEGSASMFDLGSENLTGVVDRSFVAPYYGDGTSISGLVTNAGAGGFGGAGTIYLQPNVIDNSVMSNPSTSVYMDNSAVRDYHPILSIDVRNVTSGYLGLGGK